MNKCLGCGITLQNKLPNELGYTKKLDNPYCERCFKTIHYNIESKVNIIANEEVIAKVNKLKAFVIFTTDLLSINASLIKIYQSINCQKILFINKSDLIPKNLKEEKLIKNIKKVFKIEEDIYFGSAKTGYNLNVINNILEREKKIIFCGETSSGKSSIMNKLFALKLTTSKYHNTTLDFIKIKRNEYVIYDSPGLLLGNERNVTKIICQTKKLREDFVLNIDDLKISGNGFITLFINNDVLVKSNKEMVDLNECYTISNSDIELTNGFIFVKGMITIKSNKKLQIRNSIINN